MKITKEMVTERVESYKQAELTPEFILNNSMVEWHMQARERAVRALRFERSLRDGTDIIFIIDKDHINDGEYNGLTFGDTKGFEQFLTEKFKLYDDDGNLYYEGRASNQDDEVAFEPLDWAMADSGCTDIKYLYKGKWQSL